MLNQPRVAQAVWAPQHKRPSAPILFNHGLISPVGSLKSIPTSVSSAATHFDQLTISLTSSRATRRLQFSFTKITTVAELQYFLREQSGASLVYFATNNPHLDYFLQLPHRKVCQLKTRLLVVQAMPIRASESLLRDVDVIRCIGTGGFSKVFLVRLYGHVQALKLINKQQIISSGKEHIVDNERTILELCSGYPFITKLYAAFESKNYLAFCMEYCNGGQLFHLLRKVRKMSEDEAKFYFLQTLCAITHIHSKGIVYRDLKPENIIIDSEGHLRLADFGLSKIMHEEVTYSFCGSAEYMAPEVLLKHGHSYEVDFYCLGALLYELVTGLPPHYSRNQDELFRNIINNELSFPQQSRLSPELKQLLTGMLQKAPQNRIRTVEQILQQPWLKGITLADVEKKTLTPPFRPDMFVDNFDVEDFASSEMEIAKNFEAQKQTENKRANFPNMAYLCPQLTDVSKAVRTSGQPTAIEWSKNQSNLQILKQQTRAYQGVSAPNCKSPSKILETNRKSLGSQAPVFLKVQCGASPRTIPTSGFLRSPNGSMARQGIKIETEPIIGVNQRYSEMNSSKGYTASTGNLKSHELNYRTASNGNSHIYKRLSDQQTRPMLYSTAFTGLSQQLMKSIEFEIRDNNSQKNQRKNLYGEALSRATSSQKLSRSYDRQQLSHGYLQNFKQRFHLPPSKIKKGHTRIPTTYLSTTNLVKY